MKKTKKDSRQTEMFGLEEVLPIFTGTPQQIPFQSIQDDDRSVDDLPTGRSGREIPLPLNTPERSDDDVSA